MIPTTSFSRFCLELWPALLGLILGLGILLAGANVEAFVDLNRRLRAWPSPVWGGITLLGDTTLAVALTLPAVRSRAQLWSLLLVGVLATGLTHTLKPMLDIARPAAVLAGETFRVVGPALLERSFPSGHTVTVFALAGYLTLRGGPSWRWLALLPALLVGISRIAVGAHWPADVAFGAAVGWFSAWAGLRLSERWGWNAHPRPLKGAVVLMGLLYLWLLARPTLGFAHDRVVEGGLALAMLLLLLWPWRDRPPRARAD